MSIFRRILFPRTNKHRQIYAGIPNNIKGCFVKNMSDTKNFTANSQRSDTKEADRQTFIGGSDIPAIIGVSPWGTPLDVYLKKTGQMPVTGREADPEITKRFMRGKIMEPYVIQMLANERNIMVTKKSTDYPNGNRYVDPEIPYFAAEIDFEWMDPNSGLIENGEIKTSHPFAAANQFGEDESDEVPIYYAAQALWGQMVTGRTKTLFGVLVGSDELLVYTIHRDNEVIQSMRHKAIKFWNEHVLEKKPPEPIGIRDVYHLFRRDVVTNVEANKDLSELVSNYKMALNQIKIAAEKANELKFQIGKNILGASAMETPSRKPKYTVYFNGQEIISVHYQEQIKIDAEMVKTNFPEVAEKCAKKSAFFTFNLPRRKK